MTSPVVCLADFPATRCLSFQALPYSGPQPTAEHSGVLLVPREKAQPSVLDQNSTKTGEGK
jgi:hypothetical protein